MNERKLDDHEQVSRKVNLRIVGMKVEKEDSPEKIMTEIKEQATEIALDIPDNDYDRCHRIGKKYKRDNVLYQDVLLKLGFWRTRDALFQNRKRFNFKVFADLTQRRQDLFEYAKSEVANDEVTKRVVKFVFCDKNCKLKIFSQSEGFYPFSSRSEFCNIVGMLDNDETLSDEFIKDEKRGCLDKDDIYSDLNSDLYY